MDDTPRARAVRPVMIYNPVAGRARAGLFRACLAALEAGGCAPTVRATRGPGEARALACAAAVEGADLVIAAGGDGTIGEIVNGLAGTRVPLAIVPLGTANVLAREIGLDPKPAAVARAILAGGVRAVCLGRLRGHGGPARLFVQMAGAGFDAHVVAGVNLGLKRLVGKGAYVAASLWRFAVFPFPTYRVTVDGAEYQAASVVVANGRHYGGPYTCAPDARLEQPCFHVGLFMCPGALAAARYAGALARGTLATRADYRLITGRRVAIDGPPGDPVQADGDVAARLPVEIEIMPAALDLMVPRGALGPGRSVP
ncbi:MAG: diacylglycerol/lipid kinase family protein [Kiloniellaceae bacterium]